MSVNNSSIISELRTVWQLIAPRTYQDDHTSRMETFYAGQESGYDRFRERLLLGRDDLMKTLPIPPSGTLIDMGGGTGRNIEWLEERLPELQAVTIVDLCEPLLRIARRRITKLNWWNVSAVLGDAATFPVPRGSVDAISFSYSLTMIPNWIDAVEHAYELLRPGGSIGVVDFYVSHKWPNIRSRRHSRFTRWFWPAWFSHSNVFPNPAHLALLQKRFKTVRLDERFARVPYLCGLKAPYYLFIGTKPD